MIFYFKLIQAFSDTFRWGTIDSPEVSSSALSTILKCRLIIIFILTFSDGIRAYVRLLLIFHVVGVSLVDSVIVHPQVPPVSKSLTTLCASKGPLPHVNIPLVGTQVATAGKTFTTLSAAKGPLPCMCASVHCQLRGSEEALVTKLTGMQSDSCVAQKVSALVGGVCKTLGTIRTSVRSSIASTRSWRVAEGIRVP